MTISRFIKIYLKKKIGFIKGKFKYFQSTVYFPKNSLIFRISCEEGIYDEEVYNFIFTYLKEDGLFIDVGTNIGLLSIPVLHNFNRTKVISFEPSNTIIPYLLKTHTEHKFKDRWDIKQIALGNQTGIIKFNRNLILDSAFDGVLIGDKNKNNLIEEVNIAKLDDIFEDLQKHSSIVLKIDVEGFELNVLLGAISFIKRHKPYIVIEIVNDFLFKHNLEIKDFINLINEINYKIYGLSTLNRIFTKEELELSLKKNLNFVLLPKG